MATKRPRAFWPLVINGTNDAIRITDNFNGGSPTTTQIVQATYLDPESFAQAVLNAINNVLGSPDATYSISADGKVTFSRAQTFSLDFSSGTSCGPYIGFESEVRSAATSHVATEQIRNAWWASIAVEADGPGRRTREGGMTTALNRTNRYVTWAEGRHRTIGLAWLPPEKTYIDREGAGTKYQALERLWSSGYSKFRWWPDATVVGTYEDLALEKPSFEEYAPVRQLPSVELYRVGFRANRYTP